MFDVIVAADLKWGIGKDGGMPWPKLKADMIHFRHLTTGNGNNAIIMGRKTWQSKEINSSPLPKRFNVVISSNLNIVSESAVTTKTVDAAIEATHDFDDRFIIGGAELINQSLKDRRLRYVYLTRVYDSFSCDVSISDLSGLEIDEWPGSLDYDDGKIEYTIRRLRVH